jgi:prolyl 4-hydroxylase
LRSRRHSRPASLSFDDSYLAPVTQPTRADHHSSIADAVGLLRGTTSDVVRGISLIDAAAGRHDAEALERKAVFEAMGCARPQNWESALDCLQEAAEQGSNSARRQMLILARVPAPVPQTADWAMVRSQISIGKLAEVPPKVQLSESPRLRVVECFLTEAEREWVIERARDRLRRATVVAPRGSMRVEAARTNSAVEFLLADMDLVIEAIRLRISAATRLPLPLFDAVQVLHYAPGQQFKPHHDYFDPNLPAHAAQIREHGQRIATFLIYLNDGYGGGATAFPRAHISYRGKAGDALFLANVDRSGEPDVSTLHSGTPPTSGEKWVLSQGIRDKAPAAATVGTDLNALSQP